MALFASVLNALPLQGPYPLTSNRLLEYFGGGPVSSGVRVTEDTVRGLPAAYACNRILAEGVATLPLAVFERMEPRGRRRATEQPLYDLLHSEPNPIMSSFKLRETLQGHLGFRGNAFCDIELSPRTGVPTALWPLRPDRMQRPVRSDDGRALIYPYTLPSGEVKGLPSARILHLRGLSDDGVWGYAPITVFREAFGQALAAREYGSRFFGQGARPGGVLQAKGKLSDEVADRMARSWSVAHEGLSNTHRVAVLEEGVEWKSIGMSNEDAQFIELQQFNLGDAARIWNIKPHKIADLSRATFSNIEQLAIEHVTDTLMPWLVNWEQAMDMALIRKQDRGRFYTKHLINGLLRGDSAARSAYYTAGLNGGWLSPDDIRELEDMNPLPDGLGDVYFRSLNMVVAGQEKAAPLPAAAVA